LQEENNESPAEPSILPKSSEIIGPISVSSRAEWEELKSEGLCIGFGLEHNPYIIYNQIIDAQGGSYGISIGDGSEEDVWFRIENCFIYNATIGINLGYITHASICYNNITLVETGIDIDTNWFANSIKIYGNHIYNVSEYGIRLLNLPEGQIFDNRIEHCRRYGLNILGGMFMEFENNVLDHNYLDDRDGVYMDSAYHCTFHNNTFLNDNLKMWSGGSHNFSENRFYRGSLYTRNSANNNRMWLNYLNDGTIELHESSGNVVFNNTIVKCFPWGGYDINGAGDDVLYNNTILVDDLFESMSGNDCYPLAVTIDEEDDLSCLVSYDIDWYKVDLPVLENITILMEADSEDTPLNIEIYNSSLALLNWSHSLDYSKNLSIITYEGGYYYICIFGTNYSNYSLEIIIGEASNEGSEEEGEQDTKESEQEEDDEESTSTNTTSADFMPLLIIAVLIAGSSVGIALVIKVRKTSTPRMKLKGKEKNRNYTVELFSQEIENNPIEFAWPKPCPVCGVLNEAHAVVCSQCGAILRDLLQ